MKNKLLITSALVTMVASGAALAETKVSGGMTLAYKAISNYDGASTTGSSLEGFGRETQINVTKTGDLNNGLKYAAGFAFESDGDEGLVNSNENVHFDVISGNTTISFGMDHLPNTSQSAAPRVAEHADTTFGSAAALFDYHGGVGIKEDFAIGLMQKAPVGTFVAAYVPSQGDSVGAYEVAGLAANTDNGNGAYWLLYSGNAGVKGLDIKLAYQKEENLASEQDGKVKQYGIGYNFGRYALGVMVNDIQTKTVGSDTKSYEYGATVALTDSLSAGINYIKTEGKVSTAVQDEKITTVQVGYNMGAATVAFSYGTLENRAGVAAAKDVDVASVRLSMGF